MPRSVAHNHGLVPNTKSKKAAAVRTNADGTLVDGLVDGSSGDLVGHDCTEGYDGEEEEASNRRFLFDDFEKKFFYTRDRRIAIQIVIREHTCTRLRHWLIAFSHEWRACPI